MFLDIYYFYIIFRKKKKKKTACMSNYNEIRNVRKIKSTEPK